VALGFFLDFSRLVGVIVVIAVIGVFWSDTRNVGSGAPEV
jgi:hypothetical protein